MQDRSEQEPADRLASLRDSEALGAAIVATAPDCIITISEAGTILAFNPAAERTFGYPAAAVLGLPIRDLIVPPHLRARHEAGLRRYVAGAAPTLLGKRVTVEAMRADGSLFPAELNITEVQLARQRVFTAHLRDISERRAAEAALEASHAELGRQREALHQSEKMAALGSLLSAVSHELNNPLSVVVGQAVLMTMTSEDPRQLARAEKIRTAAERCARIVKSFLALARRRDPERARVDANKVVDAALALVGYALQADGVVTELDLAADLPPLHADAEQITQVVANLLINANQALQQQDGERRLCIATAFDAPSLQVVLTVGDNGPGVPEAIRPRIFEPFFTTKPEGAGTGIGLSLCHNIVVSHGGTIALADSPDGGATFIVRLPIEGLSDAIGPALGVEPSAMPGRRVLIVDDEPEVAGTLHDILTLDGHQCDVAGNGLEALELLSGGAYDIIISDLRMPGLDGPGLYREIGRRFPEHRDRIAFVTGDTLGHHASTFLADVGAPVIEKPFEPKQVRAALAALKSL